jgi:hypothetical protein
MAAFPRRGVERFAYELIELLLLKPEVRADYILLFER